MQRCFPAAFAVLLVLPPAASRGRQAGGKRSRDAGPQLKAEEIKSLGIAIARAQAASWRQQISGYGVVTALDAIAVNDAGSHDCASGGGAKPGRRGARTQSRHREEAAVSREVGGGPRRAKPPPTKRADAGAAQDRRRLRPQRALA